MLDLQLLKAGQVWYYDDGVDKQSDIDGFVIRGKRPILILRADQYKFTFAPFTTNDHYFKNLNAAATRLEEGVISYFIPDNLHTDSIESENLVAYWGTIDWNKYRELNELVCDSICGKLTYNAKHGYHYPDRMKVKFKIKEEEKLPESENIDLDNVVIAKKEEEKETKNTTLVEAVKSTKEKFESACKAEPNFKRTRTNVKLSIYEELEIMFVSGENTKALAEKLDIALNTLYKKRYAIRNKIDYKNIDVMSTSVVEFIKAHSALDIQKEYNFDIFTAMYLKEASIRGVEFYMTKTNIDSGIEE